MIQVLNLRMTLPMHTCSTTCTVVIVTHVTQVCCNGVKAAHYRSTPESKQLQAHLPLCVLPPPPPPPPPSGPPLEELVCTCCWAKVSMV